MQAEGRRFDPDQLHQTVLEKRASEGRSEGRRDPVF